MSQAANEAVITGGEGDLARHLVAALDHAGFAVHAPGRNELDVTDCQSIESYFKDRHSSLLICNAGIIRDQPLARMSEADWDQVMEVNLQGALACARAALAGMKGGGHIVFVSSYSALHPTVGQSAYATAKAALLGLVRDLAVQQGAANIRINAVLPGFLATRMTATVSEARRKEVIEQHALGRFNTPECVAAFIRFLHQELPHTSGQTFQLDSRVPSW